MDNLKFLREKKGMTQEELAVQINVSQQSISKWEEGVSMPRADKLPVLAKIFDREISELFEKSVGA